MFGFLLLAAALIDIRRREIPDWINGSIAMISLLCFQPQNLLGMIPAILFLMAAMSGGMGGGDVKLAVACGLVLGLPAALMGSVIGLAALLLFHAGVKFVSAFQGRKTTAAYPMAPFLAMGYMAAYHFK